jgi:EmrB/QacA subfamily drug resistance transporter
MSRQRKVIGFIALTIAMFMGMLDSTIVNIALPDITSYFHATLNDTSWISTVYVMGLAVFTITASKFADQFGRKKLMIIGLVLFGGSSALCGLTHSLMALIMMRLLQSIGGAIVTPLVIPMGLEIFGKEKMQTVAGAVGAVTALAAAGGPPIGGLIIKYINWQSIFFVNVPFAAISLLLIVLFIGESYDKTVSKSIDWLGMALLTATLFLLTFALLKGNDYGWGSAIIISMFIGSAVALLLFILTESKVKAPMLELHLFRESTFTASSIICLITGFGIASPILIFSYFLQNALGFEALNAALIIMAVSLTVIVSMPLGTFIAAKAGSRIVNFCGVFCMGIGVFTLSYLKVTTSKPTMIAEMILCGFGLGFACQAIISAIKFLPKEKSGVGSGVVNAARQIGTCIGIALLVSFLDSNVTYATNNMKTNAIATVQKSSIADSVKTTMVKDINSGFSADNDSSVNQQNLQSKLESDIQKAVTSLSSTPRPSDSTLAKLYDASSSLSDGTNKALNGENTLNAGIGSLGTGLDSLDGGSKSLSSGLGTLSGGLSQALTGAQALNSAGSQGLGTLSSGINKLNNGAKQMLSQFSTSGDSNNPTVYDGVTGVANGAQSLSSNLGSYVSAVDNTFFLMIKNDPTSAKLLTDYQNSLTQAEAAYAGTTDSTVKKQEEQQIQALGNLVNLYTAGTDPMVTTEPQFEAKLESMAQQNEANQSVVSSGSNVIEGANLLSGASQKVAAQFSDGGTFKSGMEQLAGGTAKLNQSSGSLGSLQTGMNKLTDVLSQLKNGSVKLLTGSQSLQSGLISVKKGNAKLQSGSVQLVDANAKISNGTAQLASGVGLAGQKNEIQDVVNKIKSDKDDKIAGAFDKTFLLAAIILMATSIFGLFTDRKSE